MSTPSDDPVVREWGAHRQARRPPLPGWVWAAVAVLVVGGLGAATWLGTRSHTWHPPKGSVRFVACTYNGYIRARCGTVIAPEDPEQPDGPRIALHVAVLPATHQPEKGALFYLEGGPGGAATRAAVQVNQLFAEVTRDRDVVMVDQRGTGGSAPLACPDDAVPADDAGAITAYLERCFAHLHGDPSLDTTSVAAADVDYVRRALGYGKIDLYGGSYGATLAEAYLREYPRSVRSVVLDSGSLPNVRLYDVSARNAEAALDRILARCARTPDCHRAYPEIKPELAALLARAPRRVVVPEGTYVLTADDVAWTVEALSESIDSAVKLPYAIDSAYHGTYVSLAQSFAQDLGSDLASSARLATYWVIECSEPWARFDPAATARIGGASYLTAAAVARARLFRQACSAVPRGRVPADAGSAPVVDAPALLLAGGADPLDPAANLDGWRHAFPNGRLVVVPNVGHGVISDYCVQQLVARFVESADAHDLDLACTRHVRLPPFETG